MKKLLFLSIVLILSSFFLSSCSKEEQPKKTLQVGVLTVGNETVEGASVKVFKNYDDYLSNKNHIDKQFTAGNGVATFYDLPYGYYHFVIEKGCFRNDLNDNINLYPKSTYVTYLDETHKNKVKVVEESGRIELANHSNDFYKLEYNDEGVIISLVPHSRVQLFFPINQNHKIRIVGKVNSYDKTFNVNLKCGEIKTLNYP